MRNESHAMVKITVIFNIGRFSSHKSDRRDNDTIMTAVSEQEQYFIV